ncbi:MAG: hypothetical protein ACRDQ2_13690 [Gaiellales bacterium]
MSRPAERKRARQGIGAGDADEHGQHGRGRAHHRAVRERAPEGGVPDRPVVLEGGHEGQLWREREDVLLRLHRHLQQPQEGREDDEHERDHRGVQ